LDETSTGYASTPDSNALDIVGDIDVRVELDVDFSNPALSQGIVGKWGSVDADKAWMLRVNQGTIWLNWHNADGFWFASVPAQLYGGSAIRVTIDIDDGNGNWIPTWYQSESIDGEWTQILQGRVPTPLSSFAIVTTSDLRVGVTDLSTSPVHRLPPPGGLIAAFEVRDGIDGTVVAHADFRNKAPGTTSFTGGAGETWTVHSPAEVRNRDYRFRGELTSLPPSWSPSGDDVWTSCTAQGILRRLGSGSNPLQSALRRRIPTYSPLAYWPLEDGQFSNQAASPIAGVRPAMTTNFNFAQDSSLPSSSPLPQISSQAGDAAFFQGTVPAPSTTWVNTTGWLARWMYKLDTPPTTYRTFMRVFSTGTITEWQIQSRNNSSQIVGLNSTGDTVFSQPVGTGLDLFGQWNDVTLSAAQVGTGITWRVDWLDVGGIPGGIGGTVPSQTLGRITSILAPSSGWNPDLDGMTLGHISAWQGTDRTPYNNAETAWIGELTPARMFRLAYEQGTPITLRGNLTECEPVGYQFPESFLQLEQEAADADDGLLLESRRRLGLLYVAKDRLYNQDPVAVLHYDDEILSTLIPIGDDWAVVNDMTVNRIGGSSAQVERDDGRLSVNDPPTGIGRYPSSLDLSLAEDSQAEPRANWEIFKGTWDEQRFPTVGLNLASPNATVLMDDVQAIEVGSRIQITDTPPYVSVDTVDLMVLGYSEVLSNFEWSFAWNCMPMGPWMPARTVDDPPTALSYNTWADTSGTVLGAAASNSDTSLMVIPTWQEYWITSAEEVASYPIPLEVGGELMTCTVLRHNYVDTFTRTVAAGSWGTADTGQTYTLSGTAAQFSVSSNVGRIVPAATNTPYLAHTDMGDTNADVTATVSTSVMPLTQSLYAYVAARTVDVNNTYLLRVDFATTGAITLGLIKRVAGTQTNIRFWTTGLTHTANAQWRVRFQCEGSLLRAKIWAATDVEPAVWPIDATDTSLTAGTHVGFQAASNTGNTNTSPVITFDNIVNPRQQVMTVTRSQNGVVKAQTAGTSVELADPQFVAL
jgi:hypothetical protein